mgnify:CR=1 FL=1
MGRTISVVVPVYNEERRIQPTLERLSGYLNDNFKEFEIIVVDDGSSDGTVTLVKRLEKRLGDIRLIQYPANKGKGYAIKQGALFSRGALFLTCDADLSTPIEELDKLIPFIISGFDIAIGSRGLDESDIAVRQPWYREGMGRIFNLFVRSIVIGGIKDTQCGFKLFNGDIARDLFKKSRLNGFSFDAEILFLAKKAG